MIDIDYLKNVEQNNKELILKKLKETEIKFYVRVLDLKRLKNVYLNGREDTLKTIEASSALIPFYPHTVLTNGMRCADGGIIPTETIPDKFTLDLIKNNPNKKFIYIFNRDLAFPNMLINLSVNFLWGITLGIFRNLTLFFKKTLDLFRFPLTYKAINYKNVYPVVNKNNYFSFCTNKNDLFDLYNYGREEGRKVIEKINN